MSAFQELFSTKIKLSIFSFPSKLFSYFLVFILFVVTQSCEKEGKDEINRIDDTKVHQKEVIKAQKEFGEEFLVMMKQNSKVKELLIKSC